MSKDRRRPASCVCPTCGGPINRDGAPMVDLSVNSLIVNGKSVKLTKRQAELLYILVEQFPKTTTSSMNPASPHPTPRSRPRMGRRRA